MWVFGDSFDHYTSLPLKWDIVASNTVLPSIQPLAGRNGTSGMVVPGNNGGLNSYSYATKNLPSLQTYITGSSVCVPTGQSPNGGTVLFAFTDPLTGGPHLAVLISPDGHIILGSGRTQGFMTTFTQRAISTAVLLFNSPQYVEFRATIDPSAGVGIVKINGTTVISYTGDTTNGQAGSPNLIGGLQVGNHNSTTNGYINYPTGGVFYDIDDLYIVDATGAHNNDFLGDIRGAVLYPSGAGTYSDWTGTVAAWAASTAMAVGAQIEDSNGNIQRVQSITGDDKTGGSPPIWATVVGNTTVDNHVTWVVIGPTAPWMLVAENPPDGDSSYISTVTPGDKSTFAYTDLPLTSGTVAAVQVSMCARKTSGGADVLHAFTRSTGTDGEGADIIPSTAYAIHPTAFETDPHTGALWLPANVNAAEFGVKKIT